MPAHRLALSDDPPADETSAPVLRKGFRIFFLLAGTYAVLVVPLWIAIRSGIVPFRAALDPVQWHAHEMLFGFASAVITGFLLTAASNWTKRVTAVGGGLAILVVLWLAGRVVSFVPDLPAIVVTIVDCAFWPAVGVAIGRPIVAARSRRNYVFLLLVGAFFGAQLLVHLEVLGVVEGAARRGHLVAVDLVILVIAIVAGRIIPAFTRNATGADGIRNAKTLDRLALGGMSLVVVVDALSPDVVASAWLAGIVGVAVLLRARHWGVQHSLSRPLLLVLHVGYAWVAIGLLLRAISTLWTAIPSSAALHALTTGAIGTLTLGMMARVSLGHTGRVLRASRAVSLAFILMTGAAIVRVGGTTLGYVLYRHALEASATLWALAFGIYIVVLGPALLAARPDGRPG